MCVVSSYKAQVKEIERRLGNRYEKLNNFELKVKSVEEYHEGGEADVIIISTVRSNSAGSVGSNLDRQVANVALNSSRYDIGLYILTTYHFFYSFMVL